MPREAAAAVSTIGRKGWVVASITASEPACPGRARADRARGAHAHKSVTEREERFDGALGQHAAAFRAENPVGVLRRLQRLKHHRAVPSTGAWSVLVSRPVPSNRSPPDPHHDG